MIKKLYKITTGIIFVIVFFSFSTLNAKNVVKFNKSNYISDYISGVILLNENQYEQSYNYLKRLNGLEESHPTYSLKYLYSLINSGNFNQAYNFSKKLEREKQDGFESNLIVGIHHLKNSKFDLSQKYFTRAKNSKARNILDNYVISSLILWSNLEKISLVNALSNLNQFDDRFKNLKNIQKIFINCYFDSKQTIKLFDELISDKETDFSRYNYFYANYLKSIGEDSEAKKIIDQALKKHPRNLLLNQYKIDLENEEINFDFACNKNQHVAAELIYIAANALSSQSLFSLSNFYLNLSKHLNNNFHFFDALIAENYVENNDFSRAKKIYRKLASFGSAFKWYSFKQIAKILNKEENKKDSLNLLAKSFNNLPIKGIYETFDYAEFLKNNEKFKESIKYYTNVLKKIDKKHPLYPEATDGRGVAYERTDEWDKAEKDFIASLEASPDQAYVINYLAYSWIEKGIKIEKSLQMLERANKIRGNDPFIIDSLGWALFKLGRYDESKKYLQLAVRLLPADPIVSDHYGDVLWKKGNKIQARYYWNYVLGLKKTEKDLKEKVKLKLIKGL